MFQSAARGRALSFITFSPSLVPLHVQHDLVPMPATNLHVASLSSESITAFQDPSGWHMKTVTNLPRCLTGLPFSFGTSNT